MPKSTKKRRTEEEVAEEAELTLANAWNTMKDRGPTSHKSMEEYLEAIGTNGNVIEIMAASYFKSADMENRHVVPAEFEGFTVIRGKKQEIVRIQETELKVLAGNALKKMLAFAALREKGFKTIIYGTDDGGAIEVLAIPSLINIEAPTASEAKTDQIAPRSILHTPRSSTTIYVSPEMIKDVLSLDYVTIAEVGDLLRTLNSLAGKEDLTGLDVNRLQDPQQIQALLGDQSAKASRKHFLQTLLAARIRRMNPGERINYFKSSPSYTLANHLELRVPHGGPCYTKLGNKPVAAVPLGSLANDANVLMSTNTMSQKDYLGIRGDVAQYPVFVDTEALGGRRQGKWSEMNVKYLETAGGVREVLTAISVANEGGESVPVAPTEGVKEVGIVFVDLD